MYKVVLRTLLILPLGAGGVSCATARLGDSGRDEKSAKIARLIEAECTNCQMVQCHHKDNHSFCDLRFNYLLQKDIPLEKIVKKAYDELGVHLTLKPIESTKSEMVGIIVKLLGTLLAAAIVMSI